MQSHYWIQPSVALAFTGRYFNKALYIYFTSTTIPTATFAKYLFACLHANKLIITVLLIGAMLQHIDGREGRLKK